jgi:uncharacterized protein
LWFRHESRPFQGCAMRGRPGGSAPAVASVFDEGVAGLRVWAGGASVTDRQEGAQARTLQLLRVFMGEDDRVEHQPVFERVVRAARRCGLAGATVLRGSLGFGANSVIHHPRPWRLSGDLPIVVEIVDREEQIQAFLPELERLLHGGGLVTIENVQAYRRLDTGGELR